MWRIVLRSTIISARRKYLDYSSYRLLATLERLPHTRENPLIPASKLQL